MRIALTAPNVHCSKQEQPNNINKVPVPDRRFKPDVTLWQEMTFLSTDQTNGQKDRSNNNVEAVKPSRHEEVCTINIAGKAKRCMVIFIGLKNRENRTKNDRSDQTPLKRFPVFVMHERVVRPSCKTSRQQQNQCVDQRQAKHHQRPVPWDRAHV